MGLVMADGCVDVVTEDGTGSDDVSGVTTDVMVIVAAVDVDDDDESEGIDKEEPTDNELIGTKAAELEVELPDRETGKPEQTCNSKQGFAFVLWKF